MGAKGHREVDLPREPVELPLTPEKGLLGWSHSGGTWRRLKASTEITLRPAPPFMRVLVTATWQMVGVHNIGIAPEQAELEGWSSELKASLACGSGRSREAPCHAEVAPTWRMNGLTW